MAFFRRPRSGLDDWAPHAVPISCDSANLGHSAGLRHHPIVHLGQDTGESGPADQRRHRQHDFLMSIQYVVGR